MVESTRRLLLCQKIFSMVKRSPLCSLNPFPMSNLGGKVTGRGTPWMNLCHLGENPPGKPLWMPSRRSSTLLEAMMTKYMRWMTLCQERDQTVPEYTNIFHTLCSKLGIQDSERHLVLKYHSGLHRYIQTKMDFLDISSLGELLIDMLSKLSRNLSSEISREFGSANPQQQKHGKGGPNSQNKGQSKEFNLKKISPSHRKRRVMGR
jgi:hypothetical protein